jgi:hypothetical protein
MPAFLYLYVDDIDATYQRALEAGALSLEEPQNMHYGDRRGMIKDPCGNIDRHSQGGCRAGADMSLVDFRHAAEAARLMINRSVEDKTRRI